MIKRAFGFTTLLLSTLAITTHGRENTAIAGQEVPTVDPSLYKKHILAVDFYHPFDKVPSLPKNFPLSNDKVFTTLNFQPELTYNV